MGRNIIQIPNRDEKQEIHVTRQSGNFLFKEAATASQYLDMRTDISTKEEAQASFYLTVMHEVFGSVVAGLAKDAIHRLAISKQRKGRGEAVDVLRSGLPTPREIEMGGED